MVKCELCKFSFDQITNTHLWYTHGISLLDYRERFPEAPMESEALYALRSKNSTEMWKDQDFRNRFSRIISEVWDRPGYRGHIEKVMPEAIRKVWEDEDYRRELSKSLSEAWNPGRKERHARMVSEKLSGRTLPPFTPEHLDNLSKAQKARWARLTPEEIKAEMERGISSIEARRRGAETNAQKGPNRTEEMLWEFLEDKYPGVFVPYWVYPLRIGKRWPDFRTTNGYKIVIESFGSYFHSPIGSRGEEEIVAEYGRLGWNCLVVWADNPEDIIIEWPALVKRVQEVM